MSEWTRPFRMELQYRLTSLLKTITPTNGFVSDLSNDTTGGRDRPRVQRGKLLYGKDDPRPLVVITQPPIPDDPLTSPEGSRKLVVPWNLILQGFVEDDPYNPSDPAEILMADVRQLLAAERDKVGHHFGIGRKDPAREAGSCVDGMDIGPGVVRTSNETSQYTFFWLFLTIHIAEDLSKPYG